MLKIRQLLAAGKPFHYTDFFIQVRKMKRNNANNASKQRKEQQSVLTFRGKSFLELAQNTHIATGIPYS